MTDPGYGPLDGPVRAEAVRLAQEAAAFSSHTMELYLTLLGDGVEWRQAIRIAAATLPREGRVQPGRT